MERPPSALALRPASERDWPLLERWLDQRDIQRWWGSRAAGEAEIHIAFETPSAICRVIEVDGKAAGYCQAVDASLTGDADLLSLASGTWDVSLFIGASDLRGQGHGQAALGLLCREVFETTFALALSVLVPVRNETAVRIYEKAGFLWVRVLADPIFGPSWLMIRERA